jgi:hypothetical protein
MGAWPAENIFAGYENQKFLPFYFYVYLFLINKIQCSKVEYLTIFNVLFVFNNNVYIIMRIILFLILIAISDLYCCAQLDSSYIRPFEYRLAVRGYLGRDYLIMTQSSSFDSDKKFIPNSPLKIGFGITLNNTILDFGYGFGIRKEKDKGKNKSFDFQIHKYSRKFVLDLFIQKYQGFYNDESKNIEIYPDLSIQNYGVSALYILNNKKYSYKAAFNQSEKQLRSAGSILLGAGIYQTKIKSDSSFLYQGQNNLCNLQFGFNAGYAYTWVIGNFWDISASSTLGVGILFPTTNRNQDKAVKVTPVISPRITAGYNRDDWSMGFSFIGNVTYPIMSKEENISLLSGSVLITYTKRFSAVPFLKYNHRSIP